MSDELPEVKPPYQLLPLGETVVFDGDFVTELLRLVAEEALKQKDRLILLGLYRAGNAPIILHVGGGVPHSSAYKLRRLGLGHVYRPLAPDLETQPQEHLRLTGLGMVIGRFLDAAHKRAIEEQRRLEEGRKIDGGISDSFTW